MICAAPLIRAPWIAAGADPAGADHDDGVAAAHIRAVGGRAVAGRDRARQQCARHQRQVRLDLHDRVRATPQCVPRTRRPWTGAPAAAVGGVVAERPSVGMPGDHRLRALVAQVLHAGAAPTALAAHRDERHHHVVARREIGYPVTDLDARLPDAFVAADHREHRWQAERSHHLVGRRHVALEDVVVGVAQAGGCHLDEHLAGAAADRARNPRPTTARPRRAGSRRGSSCDRRGTSRAGSSAIGTACRRSWCPSSGTSCRSVTRSKRLFSIARVSTRARCMPRQL